MRELVAGQIIAGKYRLESLIGHGGMGSVWRARHVTLDMPLAIKFMGAHAEGDREARQRFDREARALGTLRTPHIVQVSDYGMEGHSPYIVMELLEGEDLSSRLLHKKRLSIPETSRILTQVARGLKRAHEAGVIHRDMKPSNIFLARVDDEEIAKVLDFGVAKLAESGAIGNPQLTQTGTLLGSPGYMSPEQARGKGIDFRSDLWALAVIVFRALTGAKPFAGDSIAELVIKLCIDPRPVPTRLAPDLPAAVDRFFERAFAPAPEDRFQSAMDMAHAFATMLGQPAPEISRQGSSPGIAVATAAGPQAPRAADLPPVPPAAPPRPATRNARDAAPGSGKQSPFTMGPAGTVVVQTKKPPPVAPSLAAAGLASDPSPADVLRDLSPARVAPGAAAASARATGGPAPLLEPTPTPGSFAGFAPSGAEASAPPAADPSALALAAEPFGAPPLGALGDPRPEGGPDASDVRTPTGMRLHQPGALMLPEAEPLPPLPPLPQQAPPKLDLKMAIIAGSGAAILAVLVGLLIAALRHGDGNATPTSGDTSAAEPAVTGEPPPAASDSAAAVPPPSATPTAEPSAAPSAEPSAAPSESAEPTAAPSASAAPPPVPTTPHTTWVPPKTTPRTNGAPTTKSSGKTPPAPTSSAKKKTKKPGFGY